MHPDTVRYWERKARIDLRGWAPDRLLRALGKGDLVQRHTYRARPMVGVFPHTMRARDGVLVENGKHSRRRICGARTRKGTPCRARAINGKGRCRFYGGMSTGPRTPEGRARIAVAQRKRWAKYTRNRADKLYACRRFKLCSEISRPQRFRWARVRKMHRSPLWILIYLEKFYGCEIDYRCCGSSFHIGM